MISVDTETTGLDVYHGARPFFVTTCDEQGFQRFWEWPVDPLTRQVQVPYREAREVRQVIARADRLVLQNSKFDAHMLREAGIVEDWPWEKTEDTLVAGHVLRSNQAHDLTTMALVYLGVNIEPYEVEMKKMVMKARNWARRHKPEWRIAKAGLPEMPSAKEKTWAYDMWLLYHYEDGKYADLVREYANADSAVTVKLWEVFEDKLKKEKLWEIYRARMECLPVTTDMERRGVTLSRKRLEEQTETYERESLKAAKMCCAIARTYDYDLKLPKSGNNGSLGKFLFGYDVDPDDPDEIQHKYLDLPVIARSKKTDAPTFDKAVVEHYLQTLDPEGKQWRFVRTLSDKRKRDTAIQYMTGYRRFWLPHDVQFVVSRGTSKDPKTLAALANVAKAAAMKLGEWFVLHPSLNMTGTDTLRWSSSNPNEQNISKKEGFNLRYSFGPAPGREWWSLDYENIELRIPAYESGEEAMIELFERPDDPPYFGSYHLLNASIVYPDLFWPLAEHKGAFKDKYKSTWYQWCKNGGFAIAYGCQEAKADATFKRAGAFKAIKEKTPKVTALSEKYVRMANKLGYVETIPDKSIGAKRGYPIWCTRSSWGGVSPTVPFNYHIQSTAMWCTARAMVRCKAYLDKLTRDTGQDHYIVLQVHDEIVVDFPAGGRMNLAKVKKVQKLMEQSGDDVGIPLKVSCSFHPSNWSGESEILCLV